LIQQSIDIYALTVLLRCTVVVPTTALPMPFSTVRVTPSTVENLADSPSSSSPDIVPVANKQISSTTSAEERGVQYRVEIIVIVAVVIVIAISVVAIVVSLILRRRQIANCGKCCCC
jgi:beta-lactamase regulating signal transducer with metallopeptidase domain